MSTLQVKVITLLIVADAVISPKVLLTVSPFSPSFAPQLDLFPCSLRALTPLSTAFTPNRSLTLLSTAFTQTHRGVGFSVPSVFRFFPHLFVTRFSNLPPLASLFRNRSLCFHILTNCFSRKPFIFTTIRIARECGGSCSFPFWFACAQAVAGPRMIAYETC
jgi:hypothetical protein